MARLPLRKIGTSAFENSKLPCVSFPQSLQSIGGAAFSGCAALRQVHFPDACGVRFLGDHCFRGCAFQEMWLPDTVEKVGVSAFLDCKALRRVSVPETCSQEPGIRELAGIRVYRVCCAGLLFLLTAALTCMLLRGRATWREVVTCFSVVGITLSFLALFWNRLDACAICAAIGWCGGWLMTQAVLGAALFGVASLLLTLTFPVEALCILTAAMGSQILWELAAVGGLKLPWLVVIPAAALGYMVQRLLSRRQTLFKKVRPDRVTYWMEERRRGKKYAHSVSEGN